MADLGEIEDALGVLIDSGTPLENITVLHCNTEYPTPFEDVNLRAMQTIGHAFGVAIGYSDHTPGIEVAVAARNILKGEAFSVENLSIKRPGTGISPMRWDDILKMSASRAFREDENICL